MTDPDALIAAQALFERVCDVEPAVRERELERADPDTAKLVRELIDADERFGAKLESSPVAELGDHATPAALPQRIGPFRILGRLGRGGSGVVYHARQDDPPREVALKLLRSLGVSDETHRRFRGEAQLLGQLEHPGIARLLDSGVVDLGHGPEPWLALELVPGLPLHHFVRARKLSLPERLRLLADVCDAVHHAHVRGIVHRDLKPANVLVREDGTPAVLDFGLARELEPTDSRTTMHTREGDVLGTLAYTSPEQLGGHTDLVGARSDVYSLGALAYEALTGVVPLDVGALPVLEAARTVREDEPAPLRTRDPELPEDLGVVVAKALEKEPSRRYANAGEFGRDLRRVLAGDPVEARPPSAWYRARRFARQNRAFVGGLLAVLVALSLGLIVSTSLYFEKEQRRVEAVDASDRAREAQAKEREARVAAERSAELQRIVLDEFVYILSTPTPWLDGADVLLVDALDDAADRARLSFPDEPLQRSEFVGAFAEAFLGLGDFERAGEFASEAYDLAVTGGASALRVAEYGMRRDFCRSKLGDSAGLDGMLGFVEELQRLDAPPLIEARAVADLVEELQTAGRLDEAIAWSESVLPLIDELPPRQTSTICSLRKTYGDALYRRGEIERAIEALSEASRYARENGLDFYEVQCENSLGACYFSTGRLDQALERIRWVTARMVEIEATEHPFYITQLSNQAAVESAIGEHDRAAASLREVLRVAEERGPELDRTAAVAFSNLCETERRRGEYAEACRIGAEAVPRLVRSHGPDSSFTANGRVLYGKALLDAGRAEEAIEPLQAGVDWKREHYRAEHIDLADDQIWLARALLADGRIEDALDPATEALDLSRAYVHPDPYRIAMAAQTHAVALALAGEHDRALSGTRAPDFGAELPLENWLHARGAAITALIHALADGTEPPWPGFDQERARMIEAGVDLGSPRLRRLDGLRALAEARLAGMPR